MALYATWNVFILSTDGGLRRRFSSCIMKYEVKDMDLQKSGKLIYDLRKASGMTQKQVAACLGVEAKTVSKWENGHGFPDVSYVSALADIFGVSERILLSGSLIQNREEVGNMKKTKFFVCPHCGSMLQGTGECQVVCCGKHLDALSVQAENAEHALHISEVEEEYYITIPHEMTKAHYIAWIAYVTFDRVLTIRLYPEQDSAVRFPKMYGGRFYYYCNQHGLFAYQKAKEQRMQPKESTNLTALLSAFARAYHLEHSDNPVFCDTFARKLFSNEEYEQIMQYIAQSGMDVETYVNTQLAPTPIARAKFCEDSLDVAIKTGTKQYVILGSGLDTFAIRKPDCTIPIFEIDKASMLAEKQMRFARAGQDIPAQVTYISADLSKDNLQTVLKNNGFDCTQKTFFSCLGLLYYLTKEEIAALFHEIASFVADGSTVLFDFADDHWFSSEVPRVKELRNMAEASGTPMQSCFGYSELELFLQEHGFFIYEFLNEQEIQKRYFSNRSDALTAFEHMQYAIAVYKK